MASQIPMDWSEKYLMDTVGADGSTGFFESMMDLPPHDDDGLGGFHLCIP